MALDRLTKVDGGGISTTSDYRVGIITASKFVGPFDGTGGNFSGVVTATNGVFSGNISAVDGNFSGNVTIGGTLTYEDVTNIDSVGIITAQKDIHVGAGVSAIGVGTFSGLDISGDIDVDGHTNLDNVSIAGVTTITSVAPELHFTDTNANSDYSIVVNGGQFRVRDETNSANRLAVNSDGHVDIYGRLDAVGGFLASSNSSIEGNLELTSTYPSLIWTDTNHNSDYRITNNDGQLIIYDITNGVHRLNVNADGHIDILGHLDVGSGIDVTGNITGNNLTLSDNDPELTFTDLNNNPDYRIKAESGNCLLYTSPSPRDS